MISGEVKKHRSHNQNRPYVKIRTQNPRSLTYSSAILAIMVLSTFFRNGFRPAEATFDTATAGFWIANVLACERAGTFLRRVSWALKQIELESVHDKWTCRKNPIQ